MAEVLETPDTMEPIGLWGLTVPPSDIGEVKKPSGELGWGVKHQLRGREEMMTQKSPAHTCVYLQNHRRTHTINKPMFARKQTCTKCKGDHSM